MSTFIGSVVLLLVDLLPGGTLGPAVADGTELAAAGRAPRKGVTSLSDSLRGQAKAAYESGKTLYQDKDFSGALLKFGEAHRLQPDPRLLWNMASCEKNLRHYRKVRALTERYLAEAAAAGLLSAADRVEARQLLELIAPFRSFIRVNVEPAGAEIVLDGEIIGTTPTATPLEIDLGHHEVEIRKPGFRSMKLVRDEAGGTEWSVQGRLEEQGAVLEIHAPDGAHISIAATDAGYGKIRKELPPGSYNVTVKEPGKIPYQVEVTLADREVRSLTPTLLDAPGPNRTWAWVIGGAAAIAAAGVASYFIFRPVEQPLVDDGFAVWELE